MDTLKKNWFSESCDTWPGSAFSFEVKEVVHKEKTPYQEILIVDTVKHGKFLALDGIIQFTEKDEFAYQEMVTFLALCCHKNPEKVLIVGGGDGGVAREVAKHPKVEIDAKVVEASKKFLPFMAVGYNSEKVKLHIGDGFEFMKQNSNEFDVIITDSSDPVGPAVALYQEDYYELMKSALKPGGIVCGQGSTYWDDIDLVKTIFHSCKNQFPASAYGTTSVASYPGGQIGFIIGSLDKDIDFKVPKHVFSDEELLKMNLKYYNTDMHKAVFCLPTFLRKKLHG